MKKIVSLLFFSWGYLCAGIFINDDRLKEDKKKYLAYVLEFDKAIDAGRNWSRCPYELDPNEKGKDTIILLYYLRAFLEKTEQKFYTISGHQLDSLRSQFTTLDEIIDPIISICNSAITKDNPEDMQTLLSLIRDFDSRNDSLIIAILLNRLFDKLRKHENVDKKFKETYLRIEKLFSFQLLPGKSEQEIFKKEWITICFDKLSLNHNRLWIADYETARSYIPSSAIIQDEEYTKECGVRQRLNAYINGGNVDIIAIIPLLGEYLAPGKQRLLIKLLQIAHEQNPEISLISKIVDFYVTQNPAELRDKLSLKNKIERLCTVLIQLKDTELLKDKFNLYSHLKELLEKKIENLTPSQANEYAKKLGLPAKTIQIYIKNVGIGFIGMLLTIVGMSVIYRYLPPHMQMKVQEVRNALNQARQGVFIYLNNLARRYRNFMINKFGSRQSN